jgi:hypothetical protein
VLSGFSMGAGMISQAVQTHEFKKTISYLVIRQMSYSSLAEAANALVSKKANGFISKFIQSANCDLDSVTASSKLEELQIPEVIIQAKEGDKMIKDEVSLASRIKQSESKKIVYVDSLHHPHMEETAVEIKNWLENLKNSL